MVLITGGVFQGKKSFAQEHFQISKSVSGADASIEQMLDAQLVSDFHLWIAKELKKGKDPYEGARRLAQENPSVVLTMAELGCGIVPADAFDRLWRETTGRISCMLASGAESIYRVTCGIGIRIGGAGK